MVYESHGRESQPNQQQTWGPERKTPANGDAYGSRRLEHLFPHVKGTKHKSLFRLRQLAILETGRSPSFL
jgi:hypothetical protein